MIKLCYNAPIGVFLEVTSKCNLRCIFCSQRAGDRKEDEFSTEELIGLIDELAAMKIFHVIITGGEPFLRKDLFRLLNRLRKNRVSFSINTNGTLLNQERVSKLLDLHIREIRIGLDGPPRINDELRGRNSFEKIVNGIRIAVANNLKVIVNTVITKINLPYLYELIDLVYSLGASGIFFNHLIPVGRAKNIWYRLAIYTKDEFKLLKQIKNKAEKDFPGFTRWYMNPLISLLMGEKPSMDRNSEKVRLWQLGRLGSCGAGVTGCSIKSNGDVVPCFGLSDYICGNIRKQRLIDIWKKSPKLIYLRNLLGRPMKSLNEVCAKCAWNEICTGGCLAVTYSLYNSFIMPSPLCIKYRGLDLGRK